MQCALSSKKISKMEITNPAVTDGVDLFVNIVIILVAFATAISLIDIRKQNAEEKDSAE